ncbi:serine O-acetyltransferase [Acidipropionibacterium jensenii]|uniref:serine O-acetyltransferase n=1 Tax=Acidipropionibacterium jensenii TaxID=1749 RepID=UPI003B839908
MSGPIGGLFADPLRSLTQVLTGAEVRGTADIGPGFVVVHSSGIVIGEEVVIGSNVRIYQGVTLGDGSRNGQPHLGDNVFLGAGSKILGGVVIGNNVRVGANAVVLTDVPDDCTAVGVPARIIHGR